MDKLQEIPLQNSASSLFREIPEFAVDVEIQLFKAAVASSVARVCRRKRLPVANNGKKLIHW